MHASVVIENDGKKKTIFFYSFVKIKCNAKLVYPTGNRRKCGLDAKIGGKTCAYQETTDNKTPILKIVKFILQKCITSILKYIYIYIFICSEGQNE